MDREGEREMIFVPQWFVDELLKRGESVPDNVVVVNKLPVSVKLPVSDGGEE
jgi:hypothetical protein